MVLVFPKSGGSCFQNVSKKTGQTCSAILPKFYLNSLMILKFASSQWKVFL